LIRRHDNPLRTSKPHFDEKDPLSLRCYFEDVDELCERHCTNPTSEEKIKRALYYTPDPRTEDLWKSSNVQLTLCVILLFYTLGPTLPNTFCHNRGKQRA
jgi:hypothetical protein